jgi:hypothetical protein
VRSTRRAGWGVLEGARRAFFGVSMYLLEPTPVARGGAFAEASTGRHTGRTPRRRHTGRPRLPFLCGAFTRAWTAMRDSAGFTVRARRAPKTPTPNPSSATTTTGTRPSGSTIAPPPATAPTPDITAVRHVSDPSPMRTMPSTRRIRASYVQLPAPAPPPPRDGARVAPAPPSKGGIGRPPPLRVSPSDPGG